MDSTLFIRNRKVLAAWLLIPLLAVAVAELGSRVWYERQLALFQRKQALEQLIPDLSATGLAGDQFMSGCKIDSVALSSIENKFIGLLNTAAGTAKFKITSISLTQAREQTPVAIKIAVKVGGTGSCRSIAAFLQNIKRHDPMLYEERVSLSRAVEGSDLLQAEAQLGRVYIANEGVIP